MKKFILFLILFLATSFVYAGDNFSLSGSLKQEVAIRIEGLNGDLNKLKNILELAGEYQLNDEVAFFMKAKYWYDAAYDIRDEYDPAQHYMGHVQRIDWLRDCYLDYTNDSWFLRLGRQQVAWGQADGITILDRVNPVDLSEYWLPDFVDIRIPLWMANINYSPKLNSNLQFLFIPDFEQSTSAPPWAPFTFRSYRLYDNWRRTQLRVNENIYFPGKQFKNSTFGLQWSDRVGDLNYTLNYLNGFYYTARNTIISLGGGNWKVDRAFKRWRMYGASFNKTFTNPGPLQGITLRGDFAYYNDEPTYFGNVYLASSRGINRWDNVFWLIGADKAIFTNWLVSFQFSQYIMQDAKPGAWSSSPFSPDFGTIYQTMNAYTYGPQDQVENIFTLKISTDFMHERLKPEVLWSFTDDNQGKLSPKVTYELRDNLWLTAGIHYFYGNEWDSNGQFRDQSQFYTNVKYTF
jgi:hypothetical protein